MRRDVNVQVKRDGNVLGLGGVMDFDAVLGQDADVPHVVLEAVEEVVDVLWVDEFQDFSSVVRTCSTCC